MGWGVAPPAVSNPTFLAFEVDLFGLGWLGVGCPAAPPAAAVFWAEGPPPTGGFFGGDPNWAAQVYWSGPADTDYSIDLVYQGIYAGSGLLVNSGDVSAVIVTLPLIAGGVCSAIVAATVRWQANCTEQVLRAFLDEDPEPGTGHVWHWEVESVPLRGALRWAVAMTGFAWDRGHVRGTFYKVHTRSGPQPAGESLRFFLS